jgi:hypothetical protein
MNIVYDFDDEAEDEGDYDSGREDFPLTFEKYYALLLRLPALERKLESGEWTGTDDDIFYWMIG